MEMPKKYQDFIGSTKVFSGGLFSHKRAEPEKEYQVLDWRWGSAKIMDMVNMEFKHPTVEFLIKNEDMKRSRWTRPFPVPEIIL